MSEPKFTALHFGCEDDGPSCLIGGNGILFARVQECPGIKAADYARLFAEAPNLIGGLLQAIQQLEADYFETPLDGRAALIRKLKYVAARALGETP